MRNNHIHTKYKTIYGTPKQLKPINMPNSTTYINQVCKKDQMGMNPSPEIPKYQKKKKRKTVSQHQIVGDESRNTISCAIFMCGTLSTNFILKHLLNVRVQGHGSPSLVYWSYNICGNMCFQRSLRDAAFGPISAMPYYKWRYYIRRNSHHPTKRAWAE